MRRIIVVAALLTACNGAGSVIAPSDTPDGSHSITITGTLGAGGAAFVDLPSDVGTIVHPPGFLCYLLMNRGGTFAWIRMGDPANAASCALESPAGGGLRVTMAGGMPGQPYAIVILY